MRTNLPLLACVALLGTVAQSQERYAAFLSGAHELPPIASPGSGEAQLTLNAVVNTLSYRLEVRGISGTAAHIHLGDRSTSGGVVFPLSGGPTRWRGTTPPLSAAQLAALDARGLYMNVHTQAQPGGEIRGQILAARQLLLYSELSGAEEVPPVVSPARGQAALVLDLQREVLHYDLRTSGLAASAAHIHSAAVGSNGGVSFPLAGGPVNFAGTTPTLSPAQIDALLSGGMYVNVHTAANPGGEIRGQVFRIGSRPEFAAELDGSQEVPPVATAGNASARLQLLLPDNTLRYELAATSLSSAPIAAHIHLGSTGVGGPVVFTLNGFLTRWCGVTPTLTPEQVLSLLIGDYYTNVHTAMHPGGEIRGQVFPALPRSFSSRLDGAQEVPPVATAAGGVARIDLDPGSGILRYDLRARGLTGTAAHIHLGAAGSNGPVAFPLSGGPTRYSGATAALTAPQIATLRTAGFYVNVHTAANPGGEIRGQVQAAKAGMRFGTGCAGSSGRAAAISMRGLPRIGDAPVFELADAASSQPAALALGASSVLFAGAVPLPLDLGFGNCTLWVDPAILTSLVTDANGCNAIALPIPGEPRLVGQEIFAQWLFVDPGANPVGIALSDALEVTIES